MANTSAAAWLDEREQEAWRAFIYMAETLQAVLNRELQADSELSSADFAVLVQLTDRSDGRARILELARGLRWEKSRLSHQLARMEKRGLVCRDSCGEDRRGSYVALTAQGRAAIEAAAPGHVATVRRLVFDQLTEEQVDALGAISAAIVAGMDAQCPTEECD
jgi:DNA-binding MarR family transcriptional regulator